MGAEEFMSFPRPKQAMLLILYAFEQVYPKRGMSRIELVVGANNMNLEMMSDKQVDDLRKELINNYGKCIEVVHACLPDLKV